MSSSMTIGAERSDGADKRTERDAEGYLQDHETPYVSMIVATVA